ncbi:phospholipase D family protein [Schlegelella sp. ID0723]|uniref:Phospholipase D family protein n=1 Tax=Piscinibacter koreensis TaxID=2742824 RepID=A0A7Y6NSF8_9BURK|nr:phospholipase D family protein [Schlegelella koreensis]
MFCAAVLATACASLPAQGERPVSVAIEGSSVTALGRIALASAPEPSLSGFRLMPSGAFALSARMELARRAEQSLDVQYFLIRHDPTGKAMLRALRDAALRGVRVRLLLDDLYTSGQDELLSGLAAHENVEVRLFNPFPTRGCLLSRFALSLPHVERLNHRMHNKLFIADGAMAVTGGRNVADEYFSRHPLANFIDLDLFVSGAVVPELGRLFDLYWNSALAYPLGSVVPPRLTLPELQAGFEEVSRPSAPPVTHEPDARDVLGYRPIEEELDAGRLDLIWDHAEASADMPLKGEAPPPGLEEASIASNRVRVAVVEHMREAKSEVMLVSPYFVPGRSGMDLITDLRSRDVRVSVLTNSLASTDQPLVHSGYRRYRRSLLELGVELYELSPIKAGREGRGLLFGKSVGGLHSKAVVFDGLEVFVGSMNFDPRSDHYNTEIGLFIHSPRLTLQVSRLARLAQRQASHRLQLTAGGALEWVTPGGADDEVHTKEPEAKLWMRFLLELLAPLAPEGML